MLAVADLHDPCPQAPLPTEPAVEALARRTAPFGSAALGSPLTQHAHAPHCTPCWQDVVAGDGTTSVVVICGALLSKCVDLLARGVHPTVISDAFGLAARKAVEVSRAGVASLHRPPLVSQSCVGQCWTPLNGCTGPGMSQRSKRRTAWGPEMMGVSNTPFTIMRVAWGLACSPASVGGSASSRAHCAWQTQRLLTRLGNLLCWQSRLQQPGQALGHTGSCSQQLLTGSATCKAARMAAVTRRLMLGPAMVVPCRFWSRLPSQ